MITSPPSEAGTFRPRRRSRDHPRVSDRVSGDPQLGKERVAFWQALGFKLAFETDHHSGLLVGGNASRIFLAEQAIDDPVGVDLYLQVTDAQACRPEPPVDVVRPFTATHWGTQVMTVRDPDGRMFRLEAPAARKERR